MKRTALVLALALLVAAPAFFFVELCSAREFFDTWQLRNPIFSKLSSYSPTADKQFS